MINALNALLIALLLVTMQANADNGHDGKNPMGPPGSTWSTGGEDLGNTRNNQQVDLNPEDVAIRDDEGNIVGHKLMQKWSYKFRGDPWTQPTIAWGKVFMGDNKGWIYCLDAKTGEVIWEKELRAYWNNPDRHNPTHDTNDPNDRRNLFPNPQPDIAATRSAMAARYSRKWGRTIIFGDQAGNPTLAGVPLNGANIYLVDADNGHLLRMTKVAQNDEPSKNADGLYPAQVVDADGNPAPADFTVLTGAMAVVGNTIITGVAGLAEANPGCKPLTDGGCTLRGRVLAFNADTLKMKWETYTTPEVKGFTGASVWQSTPAIDRKHGMVYVGTGDNYTTPYDSCYINDPDMQAKKAQTNNPYKIGRAFYKHCIKDYPERKAQWDQNYNDSILGLDLRTGEIKWVYRTLLYDTWNLACFGGSDIELDDGSIVPVNWADHCGPDMDFSHHPMVCPSDYGRLLVVGQKTGEMRGLHLGTGAEIWKTNGNFMDKFEAGLVGGWQWGAACTGKNIIGLAANSYGRRHTTYSGEVTKGGSFVVLNANDGNVKSETLPKTVDTVHPGLQSFAATLRGLPEVAAGGPPATIGAASCAGRVCGWGTSGVNGSLLLSDSETGETLWSRPTANGSVLWGGAFVKLASGEKLWAVGAGYASFDTGVGSDGIHPNFWMYTFNPELADDDKNNGKKKRDKRRDW